MIVTNYHQHHQKSLIVLHQKFILVVDDGHYHYQKFWYNLCNSRVWSSAVSLYHTYFNILLYEVLSDLVTIINYYQHHQESYIVLVHSKDSALVDDGHQLLLTSPEISYTTDAYQKFLSWSR